MNTNLILFITIAIVLLGIITFSYLLGRKKKGIENWYIGGRSLPIYVQIGTQFATVMGGAVIVGLVGTAYSSGWSTLTYGLLTMIGFIPFLFMAKWLRNSGFETMPDIIRHIYGHHPILSMLAILCTLIVPFGWMITQLIGFGNIFSTITGIDAPIIVAIFALISLAFVLPAGMTSVAWTDFIFGCAMVIGAVIAFFIALNLGDGWQTIMAKTPSEISDFPDGLAAVGTGTVLFWIFGVMPGNLTNQQLYQRIYSADNSKNATISIAVTAALFALATFWSSTIGLTVHSLNPSLDNPESATGWFLTQTPDWFLIMFAVFIVATIMSTLSSAVQSVVVTITKDIYTNYINPDIEEKKLVSVSRLVSIAVLVLAVLMAILYPQALGWIVASFAYSVSALLVPILGGFVLRDKNLLDQRAGIASILLGILGSASAHALGSELYVMYGLITSLIGLLAVAGYNKITKEN
ncbi:sodium:solute symporter family protein [Oceanobacillus sojae]|uniref:sodium:solute symporter family protein n=1 Tax=Oceanobacillus sojae TaxID=582851 RepID=UPI00098875BD|nr:sodium:solute symporter family protein [Oceanobacillus sojae]MCT1904665.1 sodium:solute symporter family protein [Oceanobacillus sojae]